MLSCEEKIYSEDYFSIVLDFEPAGSGMEEAAQGMRWMKINNTLWAVILDKRELAPLSVTDYTYRFLPKLYAPMQSISFPLLKSGILQAQQPPLALTGRNVLIGIADSGIDFTSPAFRKEDGSSRILALWDQTVPYGAGEGGIMRGESGEANMPDGQERLRRWNDDSAPKRTSMDVPYGTVYSQADLNEALRSENPFVKVPSLDKTGHGSAMAGAAGGKIGDEVYGGATDAEFVIVKCRQAKNIIRRFYYVPEEVEAYCGVDIMLAYRFIDSYCEIFKRPVVFCLGMGGSMGPHNGLSLFSEFLNDLARERSRAVVVCGGNEGNQAGHYRGHGDRDVELRIGEGVPGFTLEIWGGVPEFFAIVITSPGGENTNVLNSITTGGRKVVFLFEETVIYVEAKLSEQSSGKTLMVLRFERPTAGIWRIKVRNAGDFDMWLPVRGLLEGEASFLQPEPDTTLTEPAYAREALTISTYADQTGALWGESGRGYAADGQVKPDLAAPGVDVPVPGRAPIAVDGPAGAEIMGGLGSFAMTGSSMAAAVAAGAVAQFLEWAVVREKDVYLKGREIKSYLQRGAMKDAGTEYPNKRLGYGKLNLQQAFEAIRVKESG